ncbi:MAG: CHASE domain-containing protein, partial [Spirochaetales bacterium]|nr:CHASE domain-containing protein [Spirochaetales bacterium]
MRFIEANDELSPDAFRTFSTYLTKDTTVDLWAWVPVVMEAGKGKTYPLLFVVPANAGDRVVGLDLGSDPRARAILEEAMTSGKISATAPLALEAGAPETILVLKPVYSATQPSLVRGFALAALSPAVFLERLSLGDNLALELSLISATAPPLALATSGDMDTARASYLSATRMIMAFGNVYALRAYAGS